MACLTYKPYTMKTKKESKFTLEKFEVAKLKSSMMRKIVGGLGDGDIKTVTGTVVENSSNKCAKPNP